MERATVVGRKSWLGRNWKWVVPGGLAIFGFTAVTVLSSVMGAFKDSEVYRHALTRAEQTPEVVEHLGEPVEAGWFVTGSLSTRTGGGGEAEMAIPVSGPRGSGTIFVRASRTMGEWTYEILAFRAEGETTAIDLSAGG